MMKDREGLTLESGEEGGRTHLNVRMYHPLGKGVERCLVYLRHKKQKQIIASAFLCFLFQIEALGNMKWGALLIVAQD